MTDLAIKPSFQPYDVLGPDEVRIALGPLSDDKWEDVRARLPWSTQLGQRTLRIQWAVLLEWLNAGTRRVA